MYKHQRRKYIRAATKKRRNCGKRLTEATICHHCVRLEYCCRFTFYLVCSMSRFNGYPKPIQLSSLATCYPYWPFADRFVADFCIAVDAMAKCTGSWLSAHVKKVVGVTP
jgi:hypothetical protein